MINYKKEIISMIEEMENEDFLCKAYHYILVKYRKEQDLNEKEIQEIDDSTESNTFELNETIDNAHNELEKAIFMLNSFVDTYEWNISPTWQKAMKYSNTTDLSECSKDEEISYRLLTEYDKITKTIRIARDYCFSASYELQKNK